MTHHFFDQIIKKLGFISKNIPTEYPAYDLSEIKQIMEKQFLQSNFFSFI